MSATQLEEQPWRQPFFCSEYAQDGLIMAPTNTSTTPRAPTDASPRNQPQSPCPTHNEHPRRGRNPHHPTAGINILPTPLRSLGFPLPSRGGVCRVPRNLATPRPAAPPAPEPPVSHMSPPTTYTTHPPPLPPGRVYSLFGTTCRSLGK